MAVTGDGAMFGRDSLTWRINSESVLLMGGGRALILQVAHPKVAAGVAQHSDYREDPWGRLYRTLDVTLQIVFGDPETSREASEQLRRRHERVTGEDDRGEPYEALDPDLLLWVHATLIDTALVVYERYVGTLTAREKNAYFDEQKTLGEAFGISRDHQPEDYPAFRRYFGEVLENELRVTDVTRDVSDSILHPPLPFVARPAVDALNLFTVGALPESLRAELDLPWGPGRERLLGASQFTIRSLMPILPRLVRSFPPARVAARRAA
jgi:uncharacterized protein (DUF2236 family)